MIGTSTYDAQKYKNAAIRNTSQILWLFLSTQSIINNFQQFNKTLFNQKFEHPKLLIIQKDIMEDQDIQIINEKHFDDIQTTQQPKSLKSQSQAQVIPIQYIYCEQYLSQLQNITLYQIQKGLFIDDDQKSKLMQLIINKKYSKIIKKQIYIEIRIKLQQTQTELQQYLILQIQNDQSYFSILSTQIVNQIQNLKDNVFQLLQQNNWNNLFKMSVKTKLVTNSQQQIVQQSNSIFSYNKQLTLQMFAKHLNKDIDSLQLFFYISSIYKKKPQFNIKDLLNNPVQIQLNDIQKNFPWNNFIITPKAEGIRCLFVVFNKKLFIITDKGEQFVQNVNYDNLIIESEIIENKLYCYDIHLYNQQNLIDLPYVQRLMDLSTCIQDFQKQIKIKFVLILKQFKQILPSFGLEARKNAFMSILNQNYEIDGIIIYPNQNYLDQHILKWKPREKLTIDLYCHIIEDKDITMTFQEQQKVVIGLFAPLNLKDFHLVQIKTPLYLEYDIQNTKLVVFQSPFLKENVAYYLRSEQEEHDNPLHQKVGEFLYDQEKGTWVLIRIREDKAEGSMGNYFIVADKILNSIINFPQYEILYNIEKIQNYFQVQKDEVYKQATRYINRIKQGIIEQIYQLLKEKRLDPAVFDMACGNGQDMLKFQHSGFKTMVFVDNDTQALINLQTRIQQQKINFEYKIILSDLSVQSVTIFNQLSLMVQNYNINFIHCSLALHYFIQNQLIFDQLFANFSGFVHLLILNGQKIFDIFAKQTSREIVFEENGRIKYQIIKQYDETNLRPYGQFIQIKLPFKVDVIKEQLVNPEYLQSRMKQSGFNLVVQIDFDKQDKLQQFLKKEDYEQLNKIKQDLNEQDVFNTSLYSSFVFYKE